MPSGTPPTTRATPGSTATPSSSSRGRNGRFAAHGSITAVNTGGKKERGALWYNVGRFVYVPLAVILCCVALFMHVAF